MFYTWIIKFPQQLTAGLLSTTMSLLSMNQPTSPTHFPVTETSRIAYGAYAEAGRFRTDLARAGKIANAMEDMYYVDTDRNLFIICDGHGGCGAANFVIQHLPGEIFTQIEATPDDVPGALHRSLVNIDQAFLAHDLGDMSGTTVVIVLFHQNFVFVANTGDSDAQLLIGDAIRFLTQTHDVHNQEEVERIQGLGGKVAEDRRDNLRVYLPPYFRDCDINLTRAIGDRRYKRFPKPGHIKQAIYENYQTIITAEPFVNSLTLDEADMPQIIIMASDGLWHAMPLGKIKHFLHEAITRMRKNCQTITNREATILARSLVKEALTWSDSDNVTAIIIFIQRNQIA